MGSRSERIFEDHTVGHLQRLPVLIRDEAGLDQEAVDQSEQHTKQNYSASQHTCEVQKSLHVNKSSAHAAAFPPRSQSAF